MNFVKVYKAVAQSGSVRQAYSKSMLAVHLPTQWVDEQGIVKGDKLEVTVDGDCIKVRKVRNDEPIAKDT